MKVAALLIALAMGPSLAKAEETTFKKFLGEARVTSIVKGAGHQLIVGSVAQYPKAAITPDLYDRIITLAGDAKVTVQPFGMRQSVEKRLTEGVTAFFKDYRDYWLRDQKNETLKLGSEGLNGFFLWLEKRKPCGRYPCDIPPCCGECDGCK
jgi:hypothetical protein